MAGPSAETAIIDEDGRLVLPDAIRAKAHLAPRMEFEVKVAADGSVILRPLRDPDQAWFWTEEWQRGEREADAEIAAGKGTVYDSGEAFLQALRDRYASDPDADV